MQAERGLPDLPGMAATARQRLDDRAERLRNAAGLLLDRRRAAVARIGPRLPHPRAAIAQRRTALGVLRARADAAWAHALEQWKCHRAIVCFTAAPLQALLRERRTAFDGMAARLEAVSYQAVLARGFALVRDAEGGPVARAAGVQPGARLALTFADGEVGAVAEGSRPARPGGAPVRRPTEPRQGALL
jgi:exodeoxyribonuclease VII large subunit